MRYCDIIKMYNDKIIKSSELNLQLINYIDIPSNDLQIINFNELLMTEIKNLIDSMNLFVWTLNTKNFDTLGSIKYLHDLSENFKSHLKSINENLNLFLTLSPKFKKILQIEPNYKYTFVGNITNLNSIFSDEIKLIKKNYVITIGENFKSLISTDANNDLIEKKIKLNNEINKFRLNSEKLLILTHSIVEIIQFNNKLICITFDNQNNLTKYIYKIKLDLIKKMLYMENIIQQIINYNINIF
jgi:hypothetical protein